MNSNQKQFTEIQVVGLKNSAKELESALSNSTDPLAKEFLDGELGHILNDVLSKNILFPFDDIPYFELVTRGCLPDVGDTYLDFYSWARFGEPAYKQDEQYN